MNKVRIFPRSGQASALVGGTIQGSNDSATNGFTVLATIQSTNGDGQWTELTFSNSVPYRFIKYYGANNAYGQIAEVEFYSGDTRLIGTGFGTAGSRSNNPWQNALDGNVSTYFDGPVPTDNYVGYDLSAEHMVSAPTISPAGGAFSSSQSVTLSTGTSGAAIRYTLDGRDPVEGAAYNGAFGVSTGTTTVRAVATKSCMANSESSSATFVIGVPSGDVPVNQASLHVGNSLTDTIDGYMAPVASSGGFNLDYARYTVPGIGTWIYSDHPAGGFGVANVQNYVKSKKLDHISFQPFPNMPCVPFGHSDGTSENDRSDAVYIDQAWMDAHTVSPNVQMWVYETWPSPQDFKDCITGGGWNRDPSIWNPSTPNTWEEAESNELKYMEAVRTALISYHPGWTTPYIVPGGRALRNLKNAVDAGQFPGVASGNFFPFAFSDGGIDLHLTNEGRYLVSLVFHVSMFKADPRGLPHSNTSLTDAQALALQQIAWDTVRGYQLSGYYR